MWYDMVRYGLGVHHFRGDQDEQRQGPLPQVQDDGFTERPHLRRRRWRRLVLVLVLSSGRRSVGLRSEAGTNSGRLCSCADKPVGCTSKKSFVFFHFNLAPHDVYSGK